MIDLDAPKRLAIIACLVAGGVAAAAFFAVPSSDPQPSSAADAPAPVTWAEPIEVASGAAFRGPWRMNDSDWRFVDDPTVALMPESAVAVAWTDHTRQDLFFQRYDSTGTPQLEEPVNLSNSPGVFSWLPRMAVSPEPSHVVYVAWQEIVFSGGTHGGEIFFVRSTDGGQTFTEPTNLSTTPAGAGKGRLTKRLWHNGSLDLAVGPEGAVYVAWTEYEGPLRISRSTDGGRRFSEPLHVAGGPTEPARGPTLAVDSTGRVHLAWAVGGDPEANIHYARSDDGGRSFSTPRLVASGDGHSDAPTLALDRSGALHLAYGESPDGPLERYRIQHTVMKENNPPFRAPTTISDVSAETIESAHFPSMRTAGRDTLIVLWERYPEARGRPRGLRYTVSCDGGATFTAPRLVPGSTDPSLGFNGSQQGLLMEKLAVDGAGHIAIVNSTFQRGESSHIWLLRGQMRDTLSESNCRGPS